MTAVFALDGLGWLLVGLLGVPVVVLVGLALIACLGAGLNHASPQPADAGLRIPTPDARRYDPVAEAERYLKEPH